MGVLESAWHISRRVQLRAAERRAVGNVSRVIPRHGRGLLAGDDEHTRRGAIIDGAVNRHLKVVGADLHGPAAGRSAISGPYVRAILAVSDLEVYVRRIGR